MTTTIDARRLGVGVTLVGFLLLLALRLWTSPVAMAATDRPRVGVVAFLAIPVFLLVVGAGIGIFLWGEELGLG